MSEDLKPFVKWVGGKRTLLPYIEELIKPIEDIYNTYYEPFLGGGAILLGLRPKRAVVSDLNEELIIAYNQIKNDYASLIEELSTYENNKESYVKIRALSKDTHEILDLNKFTTLERAARFIYLNKTCFNGIWRENSNGEFNVPYSKNNSYTPATYLNEENTLNISRYLNDNNIKINHDTYQNTCALAKKNDLVYLDPPYMPLSETSSFTAYTKENFDLKQQENLKVCCDDLDSRGVKFILSNSSHDSINDMYGDRYKVKPVKMSRSINSIGSKRGKIDEFLITNI